VGLDYTKLRGIVDKTLDLVAQGTDQKLRRIALSTPANEWETPVPTTTDYPVKLVSRRVNRRYENGALVIETGDLVTFSVPAVEPAMTDRLVIDGTERVMKSLKKIPSAGTVLAYTAFVAS
jgi:hypothetical protein